MDENMVYIDSIEFHSKEEPYKDCIDFCQIKTRLIKVAQIETTK